MIDQQQPAPTTPGYPGFELTSAGLEALYATLGRALHEAFEAKLKATRATDLLQQVQAQMTPAEPAEPTPIAGKTAKAGG